MDEGTVSGESNQGTSSSSGGNGLSWHGICQYLYVRGDCSVAVLVVSNGKLGMIKAGANTADGGVQQLDDNNESAIYDTKDI